MIDLNVDSNCAFVDLDQHARFPPEAEIEVRKIADTLGAAGWQCRQRLP